MTEAARVEPERKLEAVLILVPRGAMAAQKPGHLLSNGRGPYYCTETKKFYRVARLVFPHLLSAGCPSTLGGIRQGVLGRVIGTEGYE